MNARSVVPHWLRRYFPSAALIFSALLLICPAIGRGQTEVPRFEPAECPFEGGEWRAGENIDCGYLVVPENRKKDNGRTLRLAVAILRSTHPDPEPDPVLFLWGGPGLGTLKHAQYTVQDPLVERIRKRRDYILLDQRGTGFSGEDFCPELGRANVQIISLDLTPEESRARTRAAAAACRDRFLANGVDLEAYNSTQGAADLHDLFSVLPYSTWNLFGVSSGTRPALIAMRDYPDDIRSAVLDSAVPIAGENFDQVPAHFARTFGMLVAACAADPECRETYPGLEADFHAMFARLRKDPLVVPVADAQLYPSGTFTVNAHEFAYAVSQTLSGTSFLPFAPLFVREVKNGNTDVMAAMVEAMAGGVVSGEMNIGTNRSVLCYDETAYSSPEKFAAVAARYPEAFSAMGYGLDVCGEWPSGRATADEIEPVRGDVPALLLHGEYDQVTPPYFGEELAGRLSNGHLVVFPGSGHYPSAGDSCAQSIIARFVEDPSVRPDGACLSARPALSFATDVYITGGVFRLMSGTLAKQNSIPLIGLGAILLVLLSAVLFWPLASLIRRIKGEPGEVDGYARVARWLAGVTALLALVFAVGLGLAAMRTVASTPMLLAFGLPGSAGPLFVIPPILVILSPGVLVAGVQAWRKRYWNLVSRVHYSLVAAACLGFVVFVGYWGLR